MDLVWVPVDQYVTEPRCRSRMGRVVSREDHDLPHYGGGWTLSAEAHEVVSRIDPQYALEWNGRHRGWWSVGVRDGAAALLVRLSLP